MCNKLYLWGSPWRKETLLALPKALHADTHPCLSSKVNKLGTALSYCRGICCLNSIATFSWRKRATVWIAASFRLDLTERPPANVHQSTQHSAYFQLPLEENLAYRCKTRTKITKKTPDKNTQISEVRTWFSISGNLSRCSAESVIQLCCCIISGLSAGSFKVQVTHYAVTCRLG